VLCQPLPAGIALSGQGALSASLTSSVDFGLVSCGATAPAKTATLTNTSSAPFNWTAALANGTTHYTIAPASGNNLMPGQNATITITPKAIPGTSATTADLYADTLTITTNPPLESPYNCSIHETAQGAILSFSPTSIDFGKVRAGSHSTMPFAVANSGNAAATVSLGTPGGTFTVQTSPIVVAGPGSTNDNVTFNVPGGASGGQNFNGSITPNTSSVRCAPLPAALSLTGQAK
jgi:hypothetical protein